MSVISANLANLIKSAKSTSTSSSSSSSSSGIVKLNSTSNKNKLNGQTVPNGTYKIVKGETYRQGRDGKFYPFKPANDSFRR
jgi:hypothetical protein